MKLGDLQSFTAGLAVLLTVLSFSVLGQSGGTISGNQTICSGGDPALFTSSDPGSGSGALTYQWQSSTDNVDFSDIDGATSETYDPPSGLTVTTYYKRITTDETPESFDSNVITVTVQSVPASGSIVTTTQTICNGGDPAEIASSTEGTGSGTITYRWESSVSPFDVWNTIGGASSASYDPPAGLTVTTRYRRVTISTLDAVACESSATSYAEVVVQSLVSAGAISISGGTEITVCYGVNPANTSNVTFGSSTTPGAVITYRWEYTASPFTTWTTISGATGPAYATPVQTETRKFRRTAIATVNGVACESQPSNEITINVNPQIIAGTITNMGTCLGTDPPAFVTTASTGGTGSLTYQWQEGGLDIAGATGQSFDPDGSYTTTEATFTFTRVTTDAQSCTASVTGTLTVEATKQTNQSGNWTDGSIWTPSGMPDANSGIIGCPVEVQAGNEVTLDLNTNTAAVSILQVTDGAFRFSENVTDPKSTTTSGEFIRLRLTRNGYDPSKGMVDIAGGVTSFEGGLLLDNTTLYVREGTMLVIGPRECEQNASVDPTAIYDASFEGLTRHAQYGNSTLCASILTAALPNENVGGSFGGTIKAAVVLNNNTKVVVDGTLLVYGNFVNKNNGDGSFIIGETGNVYIYGDYIAPVGTADTEGTSPINGNIYTSGTMLTNGSSEILGTTNNCLTGPCDGRALAACVSLSVKTTAANAPSPSLENLCTPAVPSAIQATVTEEAGSTYAYQWFKSTQSAGTGFQEIPGETGLTLSFSEPIYQTNWFRLRVTRTGSGDPCESYSTPVQVFVGTWLGISQFWDSQQNWQFPEGSGGGCVTNVGLPDATRNVIVSRGVNNLPRVRADGINYSAKDIWLNEGTSITMLVNTTTEQVARLDLYGLLTINDGASFDPDGTNALYPAVFTVKSTSTATQGRIAPLPATGGLTGAITVERYIPGNASTRVNRYISMPVSNVTIQSIVNLQAYFGTKLTYYNETLQGDWSTGWTYLSSNYSSALVPAKGYLAYNRGDIQLIYRGTLDNTENRGTVGIGVTYTPADDELYEGASGWNLVGNPYPSPITWNGAANVENIVYVPDMNAGGVYRPVAVGETIAMGQAFWVRALSSTTLTFTESQKNISDDVTFYRKKYDDSGLRIVINQAGETQDEAVLLFNRNASSAFDAAFDGSKFPGNPLRISMVSTDKKRLHQYSTDVMPEEGIELHIVTPAQGTFTLDFEALGGEKRIGGLYLKDVYTRTVHPVSRGQYTFSVTQNPLSVNNRFYLSDKPDFQSVPEIALSVFPNPVKETLTVEVSTVNSVPASMVALNGLRVYAAVLESESGVARGIIPMADLPAGVYILKTEVDGRIHISKVVKH
jgi:hypothetical protein